MGGPNLWIYFPIYIIGPTIGAILAAVFYEKITAES
jgi:glycerol uptake facilitator protein